MPFRAFWKFNFQILKLKAPSSERAFFIDKNVSSVSICATKINLCLTIKINIMERKKTESTVELISKAKRAVRLNRWFGRKVPDEYAFMIINQECCSEAFLKFYLQHNQLSAAGEVQLVNNYLSSKPELIKLYFKKHCLRFENTEAQTKIIGSKNLDLIRAMLAETADRIRGYLSSDAQLFLVNLNDRLLLGKILDYGIHLCDDAVSALVRLENASMLIFISGDSQYSLKIEDREYILNTGKGELIDCMFTHWGLSLSLFEKLVKDDRADVLQRFFSSAISFASSYQLKLIELNSKKYLAMYISHYSLCTDAQIELVKRGWKDILKLQFQKYGVDEKTLAYQANLNSFKKYIETE